jgi:hypothetical protein
MNWLSPGAFNQVREEQPPPRRMPHGVEHLPSPVHHLAAHGPLHELRQHIADAVQLGDMESVRKHMRHAEESHLMPPHSHEMLDLLWGAGRNTHDWRVGLADAVNTAVGMAKHYNQFLENLNTARSLPMSSQIEEFYQEVPRIIETFGRTLPGIARGPRRSRCETTIERLRVAAQRSPD